MFANSYQSGCLSVLYSGGSNPLSIWDKQVKNGHIRRVVDEDVKSLVLEIAGTNVATTYITCPMKKRQSLGVKLPFLVMIIKNMKRYFTFEIQILDDKNMHRRFRVSNFQSTTKVRPFCTSLPIGLSSGWNQVQFNLADFTKRAYGSMYLETTRVQIHANVRIRRIYFSEVLYTEEDLPNEFKLFAPAAKEMERTKEKKPVKEQVTKTKEQIPDMAPLPSPVEEVELNTTQLSEAPESSPVELETPLETPMTDESPKEELEIGQLEETIPSPLTDAEEGTAPQEPEKVEEEVPAEVPADAPVEAPIEAPALDEGEAPQEEGEVPAGEVVAETTVPEDEGPPAEAVVSEPAEPVSEAPAEQIPEEPAKPPPESPVDENAEIMEEAPPEPLPEAPTETPAEAPAEPEPEQTNPPEEPPAEEEPPTEPAPV